MEEVLIEFDVAKLAKQKGFGELCLSYFSYYSPYEGKKHKWIEEEDNLPRNYNKEVHEYDKNLFGDETISRPTQSILQKWLREVHDIDVLSLSVRFTGYLEVGYYTYAVKGIQPMKNYRFDIYELALEAGLFEALNLI